MATYKIIYKLRCDLVPKRQLVYREACEDLDNRLKIINPPLDHPYSLGSHYLDFMKHACLKQGALGINAKFTSIDYLYRFTSLAKLVRDTSGWFYLPNGVIDHFSLQRAGISKLGRDLERLHSERTDWLPLGDFATGELAPNRGFSWWTSNLMDPRQIIIETQKSGIPTDWVANWSLLMRCRTAGIDPTSHAHVPTVLDAFDSPIFHPRSEDIAPNSGIAIDIRGDKAPCRGTDEFAILAIPVENIDIWPIHMDRSTKRALGVWLSPELLVRLEEYYRSL